MADRKSSLHPTMCLTPHPAREDLTDRECAKILGGLVGSLVQLGAPDAVRRALRWWAELSDEQWVAVMHDMQGASRAATENRWT